MLSLNLPFSRPVAIVSILPPGNPVHSALVVDSADPYGEMRLKVSVPAVLGDRQVWAWPLVKVRGATPPQSGATVWVVFEGEDLESPLWAVTKPRR